VEGISFADMPASGGTFEVYGDASGDSTILVPVQLHTAFSEDIYSRIFAIHCQLISSMVRYTFPDSSSKVGLPSLIGGVDYGYDCDMLYTAEYCIRRSKFCKS